MGFGEIMGSIFENPPNGGYNQQVKQAQQLLSQTNTPNGMNREFFGQQVPTQPPPHWYYMNQPGGEDPVAVGSPFYNYPTAINSFGSRYRRRAKRRIVSSNPVCRLRKKKDCKLNPDCRYVSGRRVYGCASRPVKLPYPWEVPVIPEQDNEMAGFAQGEDMDAYLNEAGISFFGNRYRRRSPRVTRINSSNPVCRRQKKKDCNLTPGCKYQRRKLRGNRIIRGCATLPVKLPYPWDSPSMVPDFSMNQGEDMDGYLGEAGISFFGSRRRRRSGKVSKIKSNSPCGNKKKKDCKATPGCGYTSYKRKGRRIRGCRRKRSYQKRTTTFGW
jgi:hypothetical protein